MKKVILIILILLILSLISIGCSNNSRVNELEKKITDLQNQLSEKEKKIQELESNSTTTIIEATSETTAIATDEKLITDIINNYINAVEKQDFTEQKNYTVDYAMDLVNMKEQEFNESKYEILNYSITKNPISNIMVNGDNAEASISFIEHEEYNITNPHYNDGKEWDIINEGKVYLKKINDTWKISDYTKENHLISETLFNFGDLSNSSNNVEFKINYIFFSFTQKYVALGIDIINNSKERLMYSTDAKIINPDKKQIEEEYSIGNLQDTMPNSTTNGTIQFTWDYTSTNNFTLYSDDIYKTKDGHSGYLFINSIQFNIDLTKAKKY